LAELGRKRGSIVLDGASDYETLRANFRWSIPARFNIAAAVSDRWAAAEPGRPALIERRPDGSAIAIGHGELARTAARMANLLAAHGVGRGDRVAILLPQVPETAALHIAIYKLGAIAVPLALLFGVEALSYRLANSGARALVMTTASAAKLAEIRPGLTSLEHVFAIDGAGDGFFDLNRGLRAASDTCATADTRAEDPALMIYTSGTTGPPKGALHAHRVLIGHLPGIQFAHEFLPQPGDRLWTPSDWAWAGGLLNVLLPGLYFGVPVVACRFEKFDPAFAWRLIAEQSIRNIFVPPTALKLMRASPPPTGLKLPLRTLFSGGETVGKGLQDWSVATLGLRINEVYGQTECNLVLESCAALGVWRPGAIGKPVPGHAVAIVDAEGSALPAGRPGTIAVAAPDPVMFLEYWQRPEATRDKFAGGFLLTGDQGVMDEDGYFHFVGRDDDIITSAGYRIGPGEIEDCLIGHPAVKLAAVIGKPDPLRTEIVKAFVVLNDGFAPSGELAAEIQSWVRTRLSAHEYPREIAFEPELPLTTSGKVIRRLLRARA
jgi:acetyl-CoA synthetase